MKGNTENWQANRSLKWAGRSDVIASLGIWITPQEQIPSFSPTYLLFLASPPSKPDCQRKAWEEGHISFLTIRVNWVNFFFWLWYHSINRKLASAELAKINWHLVIIEPPGRWCNCDSKKHIFDYILIQKLNIIKIYTSCFLPPFWFLLSLSLSLFMQLCSRTAEKRGDRAGRGIRQRHDLLQRHRGLHIHVCREHAATGTRRSTPHRKPQFCLLLTAFKC